MCVYVVLCSYISEWVSLLPLDIKGIILRGKYGLFSLTHSHPLRQLGAYTFNRNDHELRSAGSVSVYKHTSQNPFW